jgi:hypothetical protein
MSQTALLLADDIVIIASGTILLIVLAIYGFVFLTHRFALDKEYELKEHYNRILQFTGAYKFKYLEILAKDNPILEQYSNNLKKNKNVFEQSLKLVQAKLMVLTSANANYHFAHTRNLIKAIEQDLEKCDTMIDYFRNVSINTTKYTKSASDILTQYRKIADHVINFYEFHLALRYDHDVINNMIKLINESFVNAFGLIKHPKNNVELIHAISELNKHTTNMYHIVGELYILDHILMFLMSRQKHLDRIMEKYSHRLSSADQYSVDRNSATAKANITNASVAIKELKFNEARNAAVIALKHFNSAISKIEMGEVTNALAQKNMSFLNAQIDILKKDLKEITIAFNNIKRFFNAKDPQITNSIYQLGAKLKNIDYFHQTLQSEFNNFENIQREDFLIKVNTLINDLMS